MSGAGRLGAGLIWFWVLCVKLVALGFLQSYFWTASTAIYYLLRRDVDATEMDEVYLEDDQGEEPQGLPPLATDERVPPSSAVKRKLRKWKSRVEEARALPARLRCSGGL